MEQRLKERLTGAAILVALVVLVVPELFHGRVLERGGKTSGSGEGPPLRSYLIDLGGTHSTPMQLGPAVARGLAPAVPSNDGSAVASESAPAGTSTLSAHPTPTAPVVPPVFSAPAAKAAPSTSAPAPAHASAPHTTSHPKLTVATASSTHTSATSAAWSVQLGLFAKRTNAEHLARSAHAKGFSASVSRPDAKGRYHVHVAGLSSRSAALTLAARLRAAGLPAAAVGPQ